MHDEFARWSDKIINLKLLANSNHFSLSLVLWDVSGIDKVQFGLHRIFSFQQQRIIRMVWFCLFQYSLKIKKVIFIPEPEGEEEKNVRSPKYRTW